MRNAGKPEQRASNPLESRLSGTPHGETAGLSADERSQVAGRLRMSPSERLRYLEDVIAFEELARLARRLT